MKKNQHGFTLAELLVVIAIVGILAAISIPIFTAQRKKAVIAANQANVRAAKAAAVAMLYGSKESLERYENQPQKQYRYYQKRERLSVRQRERTRTLSTHREVEQRR